MLHTTIGTENRVGAGAAVVPAIVTVDRSAEESSRRRRRLAAEQAMDRVLADSFPASDPPSWNPGIALPIPAVGLEPRAERSEAHADDGARTRASGLIDVSRSNGAGRTFFRGLVSLAGASGIALLVPFAILLIGLPIALSVRGVLELFSWLFGVALQ